MSQAIDRAQIIAKYATELKGIVADAAVAGRKGGELAIWLQHNFTKIEARVGMIYDDATGKLPEPVKPKPGVVK